MNELKKPFPQDGNGPQITGKIPPECHTTGKLTITGRLPELRGQERPQQVTQILLQPPRGELRIEKSGTSKGLERQQ